MIRRGIGSYPEDDDGSRRDFFPRERDNSSSRDQRYSKKEFSLTLFVHRALPNSLLCSEHGRNDYANGQLAGGKVIPWSKITWPAEEERKKFDAWNKLLRKDPIQLVFAIPEWLAYEKGLI